MAYSESDIEVLEALEAVRRRPAMYLGEVGQVGVNRLAEAVIGNAVGEVNEGHASRVRVVLRGETLVVEDDGRGFPVDVHPLLKISALELIFTALNLGCNCGCGESPGHREGDPGFRLSVVNALSAHLEVETVREGSLFRIRFERGRTATPLEALGPTERRGSRIAFCLDRDIFGDEARFDTQRLTNHIDELALRLPVTFERA